MEVVVAGYRFPDNQATVVCEHVFTGRLARCLFHDHDGDLQVTCGSDDHDWSKAKLVTLANALAWLPSVSSLPTVKPGFVAEWTDPVWTVEQLPEPIDDREDY